LEGHEETVGDNEIYVSAKTGYNINKLKEKIASLAVTEKFTDLMI